MISSVTAKSPLREQQQTVGNNINLNSKAGLITGERQPHFV